MAVTNIAAYQFAQLDDLPTLRQELLSECKAANLKGTILLSMEGINLFVAGERTAIDHLVSTIHNIPSLEKLTPKYSESDDQPFSRMLVRIKKEIISFGVEGIEPGKRTSPKLSPRELKSWLDEGRPVTLLDTRNDYEVKLGTFQGAIVLGIDHFREFPKAVEQLPEELKQTPIVMFCTGGIRCEKAGPYMEREGYENIFQLDGGILKYFEEVGADHYQGECFVFDHRVGVDPALRETDSALCFVCQSPLTPGEQNDHRYVPNVSCPHCYKNPFEKMVATLEERHRELRRLTSPLPGSLPGFLHRPFRVTPNCQSFTMLDALCYTFPAVGREKWITSCIEKLIENELGEPVSAEYRVQAGERYYRLTPTAIEPDVNTDIRILHEDEALIVVEKPVDLPTQPDGVFLRNTLQSILGLVYEPQKIQPMQNLPADTGGLIVCARSRHFQKKLEPQFHKKNSARPLRFRHPVTQEILTFE